jgi:hypothetical protein
MISSLSRMIAQPPGLKIRSISTTIERGCLHLQHKKGHQELHLIIVQWPFFSYGNINKPHPQMWLSWVINNLLSSNVVIQEKHVIQKKKS